MADSGLIIDTGASSINKPEGPWWARFATIFGVPALLALYFAWALVTGQQAAIASIETKLDAHTQLSNMHLSTFIEMRDSSRRTEQLLRILCVSTAKTDVVRDTCLAIK